ncbi:hypothetical protein [Haladaptatus sp. DFWS20]|uniref:hypothetical protein n=1 Tax=Haladaptatus sp. DFWS20 TaxID=3403467 RepID=UPI003EBE69FD
MRPHPFTIGVLAVLLVSTVIAGSTLGRAQSTPPPEKQTETPNTTAGTTTTGTQTTVESPSNATAAFDGTCTGMGVVSSRMCNGVLGALKEIAHEFLEFARGTAEWSVEFIVSRPVPMKDGTMEFVERPTNAPMDTVYDLWYSLGLPAGVIVWAFSMILLRASVFMPSGTVSAQRARSLRIKGWFLLFFILGSWIWCAVILHLTSGLTLVFAPSGAQIVASFETIVDSALAASLGGLLLWLSSGVLFLFVAFVFGLSWLAVYVLMPAMPVFIALSLPAVWLFRPVASVGQRLRGLFVPCAFIPFPAAVILGVGYPVINAVSASLDSGMSSTAGVDSFAYIILVLVMWFCAAVSPLFLFVGSRRMRPFAALTAGALGAASGMSIASRSGTLRDQLRSRISTGAAGSTMPPNAGVGKRIDPIAGSPFARRSGNGGGGSLGQPTIAGELEPGRATDSLEPFSTDTGGTGTTGQTGRTTQSSTIHDEAYDSIPSDVSVTSVTDRGELTNEQYDVGYFDSRGKFQSVSQGPSNTGWLVDEGAYNRFAKHKSNETVLLYSHSDSEAYNVQGIVEQGKYRSARYEQEHRNSLRTVERTRNP